MQDDEFEWDAGKARANYAKHGVNFEMAREVFNDPLAIDGIDDRGNYGEARLIAIGRAQGEILYVVYTERNGRLRLISARPATKREKDDYVRQFN
jgi:hypothetical protein